MENNNLISERVNNLSESATIQMTQKSRELKKQGLDIIALSIGEPDFNTPEIIKKAAYQAIEDNFTHYPPVAGYTLLREAIQKKFKRDNNIDYDLNQIIVSNGAKQSLANVLLSIINPGDEVVIPCPYWVSYPELVKIGQGTPVYINTTIENKYKVQPHQIEEAITDRTKAIILNSPSNPTGVVYTYEETKALVDVLKQHPHVIIISDEIYELINYEGSHISLAQFPEIKDRVVTINGVSKGFAMTGWRIGYIGAPLEIANACNKIQGQYTSGPGTISQMASKKAIETDPKEFDDLPKMVAAFKRRRDLVVQMLQDIPGVKAYSPDGAFYIFPDVSYYFGKTDGNVTINNSNDLCMYILNKAHVALVPGEAFGEPSGIRISFATSESVLEEAMLRLKKALSLLN
ncbi:MAG: pyridoxal phosphate-dependent aminotransferase [Hyphomicrobiales bacterium]